LYNSLVREVNRVEASWGQVQVQLERRHDLVPNLVEAVKGYASHESGTLAAVVAARNAALAAASPSQAAGADDVLTGTLRNLFALAESYPDLKASANFVQLQRELSATEDKVAAARHQYNAGVQALNTRCETFPSNLVASSRPRFVRREYFSAPSDATTPPSLDL
jgi:LemA protein